MNEPDLICVVYSTIPSSAQDTLVFAVSFLHGGQQMVSFVGNKLAT
jgi:hypothetical protein